MKKASIVSIGNEILSGQTVDTNTSYLSGKMFSIGVPVVSVRTVGDDIDFIVRALVSAIHDADFILVTGGLGPTGDDLTRPALAKKLDVELQLQEEMLQQINDFFDFRGLQMPPANKVQAYIPAGAKAIKNNIGTAPGIMAQFKGRIIFALPGVPSEMKQMFEEYVLPELKKVIVDSKQPAIAIRKLKCFGAGESTIARLIGDMMQRGRNPLINSTAVNGIVTLHIIATTEDKLRAEQMAGEDEKLLRNKLADFVYGTAEQSLAEVVGAKLAKLGKKVATAESCTGGILAKLLTDVPGASRYFTYGWVTYSNQAKIQQLSVPADLLEKYGAVSEQIARAMAKGARKNSGADFSIGITGIAGPAGGSEQKPVGLVYISVDSVTECEVKRLIFSYERQAMRLRTANTALNMLRLKIEKLT
ncbi:competence/damage-inducible protein A [Planctomycetota bacterium]